MSQAPSPPPSAALAVVPLMHDDRDAPGGCAALRELRGRTLVHRAVTALVRSGRVDRVVVPAPPAVVDALATILGAGAGAGAGVDVEVIPVVENGLGLRVLAALRGRADRVVVVHDPLHPMDPAGLLGDALDALAHEPDAAGAVPLGPVTDTLKWVDEDDVVTGTADREAFRTVHSPQVYRAELLAAALSAADPGLLRSGGPEVLPAVVRATGGRLCVVTAPAAVLRVVTEDDLVLAEIVLAGGVR